MPSWGQFTEPCVCVELGTVYRAVCVCRAGDSLPSRSVCVELGTVYRAVVCVSSWGQFTEL